MKSNKFKIMLALFILIGAIILTAINSISKKGVTIKEWDNYYSENNIVFFYDDKLDSKLQELENTYGQKGYVANEQTDFDKALKITNIVHTIVEKDGFQESGLKNGADILKEKKDGRKVSFRDMAIITKDLISSVGIKSRIGIFRSGNSQFNNNTEYYVVEFWSNQDNKWIMIDFLDQGYFIEGENKLSAIEVLNKDIKKIAYLGNTGQKDYKNNINKYLDSYTLQIENSASRSRSNCKVTYLKNDSALEIKYKNKFAPPTIFTKETKLFEKSPFDNLVSEDSKAYLLVCGSNASASDEDEGKEKETDKDKSVEKYTIAAFKDDSVMKSYYININDAGYEKVDSYKEINLEKGTTKIELSLDGTNKVSSVTIEKK